MTLKISQNYMTNNDCYKTGRKITPKGVMVHSDACMAGIKASGWYSRWNKPNIEACVHAFVDDNECIEYLPTGKGNCHRGWHGGGSSNNTHIGFEMCEPTSYTDAVYFNKVYANAVEYTAHLLKVHGISVVNENTVLCHCEGYKKGIATNHSDVMHWFKYHNKTMDDFRNDVRKALNGNYTPSVSTPSKPSTSTSTGYTVTITADVLNVRSGASTSYPVTTTVKKGEVYTIVEESNGWGKLKSGAGWISLAYTSKGSTQSTPVAPSCDREEKRYTEHGTCKIVAPSGINFRDKPCTCHGVKQGAYEYNEKVKYDLVVITEKYVWISWVGASSGKRRYMPVKDRKKNERWGNCY